jgi:dTDP-4-amino-4,6-dideoxygalactose transaminase
VSDLTFVASANPARYCGARVTLVDSEPESWNLDPYVVAAELDRRAACGEPQPAAIVAVHLLGHPARLDVLLVAAAEHGVPVVEDAAESLAATWTGGPLAGREVGTAGTIGCFSFNGNKLVTSGGGGMLVTANEALAAHARHLSTQAKLPGVGYAHDEIGFNYRLSNLSAALGLAQFEQVDTFLARRRAIAQRYDAALASVAGLRPAPDRPWARRSGWLSSVVCPDPATRERIRTALDADDIEARPVWAPLRHQAPYRGTPVLGGDVAVQLGDRVLNLPSSVTLTDEQQERVIDVVLRAASTAAA